MTAYCCAPKLHRRCEYFKIFSKCHNSILPYRKGLIFSYLNLAGHAVDFCRGATNLDSITNLPNYADLKFSAAKELKNEISLQGT